MDEKEKTIGESVRAALNALEKDDLMTARRVIKTEIKPKVPKLTWHEAQSVTELLGVLGAMEVIIAEKKAHPKKTKAWFSSLKSKQESQMAGNLEQLASG